VPALNRFDIGLSARREIAMPRGVASEPVTTAILVGVGSVVAKHATELLWSEVASWVRCTRTPVTLEKRTTQANVGPGATSSAVQISVDLAEAKSVPTEVLRILTTD
jgi:hypothetical protein